jgi:hypothetical protein
MYATARSVRGQTSFREHRTVLVGWLAALGGIPPAAQAASDPARNISNTGE